MVYIVAITLGLCSGYLWPQFGELLEHALWPVLALLLYCTFTQIPLAHLPKAFLGFRFLSAAIAGNFVIIPILVWLLLFIVPDEPALKLGIAMVLLVPCTDWFITFTQLGGGDTKYAIAFSPISLILQFLTLPIYLLLFFGKEFTTSIANDTLLKAFIGFIVVPLFFAFLTERWAETKQIRLRAIEWLGWLPVPILAIVLFIICSSQVQTILAAKTDYMRITIVFVLFLIFAALLSKLICRYFRLAVQQGRVLAYSMGTRNSFVILPIALALPAQFDVAVVVIVYQSLLELIGMVFYIWIIPKKLFQDAKS